MDLSKSKLVVIVPIVVSILAATFGSVKYIITLIVVLLLAFTLGCSGVKHVLQIEEPTDHTQGDDGGKVKYKIIWGDINQKE